MPYSVEYNFYPDDIVWVLNRNEFSVKRGKCVQVDIRIYKDAQNVYNHIIYWVILDNERGSSKVAENDIFGSIEEATAALAFLLNPTPTPSVTTSVTPTPNPTQTNTPSVTTSVTPTPTNTVTPTITQTPIPSGTAVPTMTPTPSVTTSMTPTVTNTATPTPTVTTSTISGNNYQSIVLNDNPIAFWRMNESSGLIINELVSNNIATFSTDPIRNVDGISGKCLGLETSPSNYATIETPITIDKGYSIEFWTKPQSLNDGYSAVITDNTIVGIVMAPVFKFRLLFTGTNQIESESIDAIELNEWNHVCVVLNSNGIVNYYVNGELVTITYTNTDPINLTTIHGNNNYIGHSLDELAIYDYELTEQQIVNHYLGGIAEILPQITLTPTPTVTPTPSPTMVTPTPTPSPIVSNDFTMIMRYYDDNDQQYLYNYVNYIENATDTTSSNALHFIDDENPLSNITNQYDFIYKDLPIIIAFTSNSITSILSRDDGNNQLEIVQLSDYIPVIPNKIVVKVKAYNNELFMLTKLGASASYIEQMNYSSTNLQIDYPAKLNEMHSADVNSFDFEKFNNVFVIVEHDPSGDKKFSSYKYENNSLTLINTYSDNLLTYFNIVKISNTILAIIGFANGVPDIRVMSVDDTLGLQLLDSDNTTFTAIPTASYAFNNILFLFEAGTPAILRTYDNNLQLLDSMNVSFNISGSYQYRNYIIFNTDANNIVIVKFDPVTGEIFPEVVTTQIFSSGKIFGIINKLNA